MANKEKVIKRWPEANLVREGWDVRAGISGCFDCAIYSSHEKAAFFLGQGETPRQAWASAALASLRRAA